MALIRPIRPLPIRPTAEKLRQLMRQYGLSRSVTARLMRCAPCTISRYLRPAGSQGASPIPLAPFELLLVKLAWIYHPDEPVDLPL